VWCCLPRFDSPPVFGALLDAARGGRFTIGPADGAPGVQRYLPTPTCSRRASRAATARSASLDFAPRFVQYERSFRPTKLVRIVEPIGGTPRIRGACEPVLGWSQGPPRRGARLAPRLLPRLRRQLRLTTDAPLSYLGGHGRSRSPSASTSCSRGARRSRSRSRRCASASSRETVRYWQQWVKHCDVPAAYQEEVIRSALALKLHCFEDTGAIVAALTTSLPEAPGSGRTWDYRYCWLRDAYYALGAFRLLGHFEEREQFLQLPAQRRRASPDLDLRRSTASTAAPTSRSASCRPGPATSGRPGPRRQRRGGTPQHDVFGEMVLALTPMFLDARFAIR
jgi:hypothetical protein